MNQQTNRPDDYRFPQAAFEGDSSSFVSELESITREAMSAATETHRVDERDVDPSRGEFGESVIKAATHEQQAAESVAAPEASYAIDLPTDYLSLTHTGSLVVQMRRYELPDEDAA